MAKKIGSLVMEIQLNTQKAVEEATNVNQQLKILKSGYRDLTRAERELGKSEDSFKARGKLLKEESKLLEDRSKQARKDFDEFKQQNKDKNQYTQAQIATYNKLNRAVLDADTKYNSSLAKKKMNEESFSNYKKKQIEETLRLEQDAINKKKKLDEDAQKQKQKQIDAITKAEHEAHRINNKMDEDAQKQKQKHLDDVAKAEEASINKQKKLESELQAQRKKNLDEAVKAAEKGSEAIMKAVGAAAAVGGVAMNNYMEHEASLLDVTRVARGTEEQNKLLEEQLQEFIWARPEDNENLLAAAEVIVKAVDPANYGDINNYLEDIANASMASNKALDEVAKESMGLVEKGVLSIDDIDNYYSAMNETQNRYGTDMGMQSTILNSVGSQAMNNNITIPDMIALAGYVSKVTSRGAEASSSSLVELSNLFGSASYDTSGADLLFRAYGGNWDAIYQAQVEGTEEYKAIVDATGLKMEDLNKQLDTLAFRDDVAKYTGRSQYEVTEMIRNQETGTLFAEFFEGMRKQAEREDVLLSELTASKGYFKNNVRLQEMIADLSSAGDGVLADYMETANQAYIDGTSVDDEATAILELTLNRFKVWMGKFKEMWVDFGAIIAPGIMQFLEEDIGPWVEMVHNIIKKFGELDVDIQADVVQNIVQMMTRLFLAAGALKGVIVAYKGFNALKGGLGALGALGGVAPALTATATEGAAAVGALGKLKVGIAALASPVGLVVGGLGLLAGGLYALHQYQERQAERAVFNQSGDTLNNEQKERITNDVSGTRSARAKTAVNVNYDIEVAYTEQELKELESGVKNQVDEIKTQLNKTAEDFTFTITGDAELDAKMSERAKKERDDVINKQKEAEDLQSKLLTIYAGAIESGGELTSKQIEEIQRLQKELDIMYAKHSGGDEDTARGIYTSVQNQGDYSLLSNKEAEEIGKGLSEELSRTEVELRKKLQLTDTMLQDGEITSAQAELQRAKDLEFFEGQKARILAEAAAIRYSRNTWDKIWYDDELKHVDGYSKKQGKGMAQLKDMQNIGAELIIDTGERDAAFAWIELIESVKNNKASLDSFMELGSSDLFNAYTIQNGTQAFLELQAVIGELLPRESQLEMATYVDLLIKAKQEAGTLTSTEFKLYVESNLQDSIREAVDAGDLWEDTEFRNKLLTIDLNSFDADMQVRALLDTYDTVPDELITAIQATGVGVALHEIRGVRDQMLDLDGTIATVRINTINGASQVSKNTIVSSNMKAKMAALGVELYAQGTSYHPGGLAILGDGGQHEPFITPDGRVGISPDVPTLFNIPEGTKVSSSVQALLKELAHIPRFATGTASSFLDSVLKGDRGVSSNTSNQNITNLYATFEPNSGVSKSDVEQVFRKLQAESERRSKNIQIQLGVV